MPTWRELREHAERALAGAAVTSPTLEAHRIVEEASGRRGGELVLADAQSAPRGAAARVERMVARRVAGEPLQYVLGSWAFLGLDVMVDARVLIPRPETEITAQVAIDEAVRLGARRGRVVAGRTPAGATFLAADLGTGSGVLALALASALRDAEVWATDVSTDALAVARANLAGAGAAATQVRLAQGDWFDALPDALRGRLRLVVANPPYVTEGELDALAPEIARHEPRVALVSGPTGLEAIERIVADAPEWLDPGGALVCELAPQQRDAAIERVRAAGFEHADVRADLTGRDRVLVARRA